MDHIKFIRSNQTMNLENKKIGIWGFGVVGKSALRFFNNKTQKISVMDQKPLSMQEKSVLDCYNASFYEQHANVDQFFADHDYILPSPGIDLRPFKKYKDQFINELDLFQQYWHKPIIAITGTVGKTTVTHLLAKALEQSGKKIAAGGNIGVGMLDLVNNTDCDYAVLEVSSFQLEQARIFAPDLAIITNIYANHLDHHENMRAYIQAKLSMIQRQQNQQNALIPHALATWTDQHGLTIPGHCISFGNESFTRHSVPPITFQENWSIIGAALQLLGERTDNVSSVTIDATIQEHRLEYVGSRNGIAFYNDSKSTISQSTISATIQLQDNPILLLLGGINKSSDKKQDRAALIRQLPTAVSYIAAFGTEAELIKEVCSGIACDAFKTLEDAFNACFANAKANDQILLSPGGSSYDLYTNYKERGTHFKKLVAQQRIYLFL